MGDCKGIVGKKGSFLISLSLLFACSKGREQLKTVTIGAILPLSGDAVSWGQA
jgi:hypothetical protein